MNSRETLPINGDAKVQKQSNDGYLQLDNPEFVVSYQIWRSNNSQKYRMVISFNHVLLSKPNVDLIKDFMTA